MKTPEQVEQQRATIRAMVAEIGFEPEQDAHFDYWHYPEQIDVWGFEQRYEQAVVRRWLEQKFGPTPSAAVAFPMDVFLAFVMEA